MNKRAHKNWKTFRKLFRYTLTICIKQYFLSHFPPKQTFSQAKPNLIIVSSESLFSKNLNHTETSQLIHKARPLIGFYMIRVFK